MEKINYTEVIRKISKKTSFSQKDIKEIMDAFDEVVFEEMVAGNSVTVTKFITVETADVKARECRNPQTGELITVPAHRKPKAKFGKKIKDAVK